jgi:hypothetical protein
MGALLEWGGRGAPRCRDELITVRLADVALRGTRGIRAELGLGHVDGGLGLRGEPGRERVHVGVELGGGHDPVDEPDAMRLGGIDAVAEQDELTRAGRTELVDQARRPAPRERDAEIDLGHVEDRVLGGDAEVTGRGEHDTAADDVSVQARDGDDLGILDRTRRSAADLRRPAPLALARVRRRREPLGAGRARTIGTRTEGRAAPAEDHDARDEVGGEPVEELRDLLEGGPVERVPLRGTIEPDAQNGTVVGDAEPLPVHGDERGNVLPCRRRRQGEPLAR